LFNIQQASTLKRAKVRDAMNDNAVPACRVYLYGAVPSYTSCRISFTREKISRSVLLDIDMPRKVALTVYTRMIKVYHLFAFDKEGKSGKNLILIEKKTKIFQAFYIRIKQKIQNRLNKDFFMLYIYKYIIFN